ncbi:MAG: NADH-quinone oxidoreductase subunit C [Acidimicrobiia bacterium]|nr:NADH-quinone oxidoreductase subunit C [Acidimicrobiia bacterium]
MTSPTPTSESVSRRTTLTVTAGTLAARFTELVGDGHRLALVAGHDDVDALRVVYLFLRGGSDDRVELVLHADHTTPEIPSLSAQSFTAGRFEREVADLFGVVALGHTFPRRLVHHQHWPDGWHPLRRDAGPTPPIDETRDPFPFVTVEGPGVYEIPVGPVHAGLIEPGHFRFSVVGETIITMKARLWFVHKGIEKLFEGRHITTGVELAERISGDTAVGHNLAYCLAVEEALGVEVPPTGQYLRALLLELERLYNHAADIGALANDVGYGILHAHASRIREQLLRMNSRVTGQRLLRGSIVPGGVHVRGLPDPAELTAIAEDLAEVADLALANSTVVDRFAGTSILPADAALQLGTLGPVARASGIDIDARRDHPFVDLSEPLHVVRHDTGDVHARFCVRRDEFAASIQLIHWLIEQLAARHGQPAAVPLPPVRRPASGVGIAEGWRGTIVHRVEIEPCGKLTRVKIVDPSFFNWPALPVALADTIVPDFPLTNKSFNLSYAGNDL